MAPPRADVVGDGKGLCSSAIQVNEVDLENDLLDFYFLQLGTIKPRRYALVRDACLSRGSRAPADLPGHHGLGVYGPSMRKLSRRHT